MCAEKHVRKFLSNVLKLVLQMCVLYSDSRCSVLDSLEIHFGSAVLDLRQMGCTISIYKIRIALERYFTKAEVFWNLKVFWNPEDCMKRMCMLQIPSGIIYEAIDLLENFPAALSPTEFLQYFECCPLTFEQYLATIRN